MVFNYFRVTKMYVVDFNYFTAEVRIFVKATLDVSASFLDVLAFQRLKFLFLHGTGADLSRG